MCSKQHHLEVFEESKQSIDTIRGSIPFQKIHISLALKNLAKFKRKHKSLSKEDFTKFLEGLIKQNDIKPKFKDSIAFLSDHLFNVYDPRGKGLIQRKSISVFFFIICGKLPHPPNINFFRRISQRKNTLPRKDVRREQRWKTELQRA